MGAMLLNPFDAEKYEAIISERVMGEMEIVRWLGAGEALGGRDGWRFEVDGGLSHSSPAIGWLFGPGGSAHLVITIVEAGYLLYMADTDTDRTIDTLAELTGWLDANEAEYAKWTPGELELKASLEGGM